jgi:enterochelin esterase-like enzyme
MAWLMALAIPSLLPTWSWAAPPSKTSPVTSPSSHRPNQTAAPSVVWVDPDVPSGPGLLHRVLASKALGHDVGYVVWTPRGYEATKRYPVLYFLHGVTGTESADAAGFSAQVAAGIASGALPPVMVVFPNGGLSGYRDNVETMIVDELVPLIDRDYRTLARAESRAVVGFSMGGAGAIWLATAHPGLFGAAASWAGADHGDIERMLAQNAPTLAKRPFAMLLVNGENDRPDGFRELVATCRRFRVSCTTTTLPGVGHDLGAYYAESARQVMIFLGRHLKR